MRKITRNEFIKTGVFIGGVFVVYVMLTAAWQNASEGNYTLLVVSSLILAMLFIVFVVDDKIEQENRYGDKRDAYYRERLDAVKLYSSLLSWKTRDTLHYMAQDMIDGEGWKISSENKEILSLIGSMIAPAMTRDLDKLSGNPFVHTDSTIRYDLGKFDIGELDALPAAYLIDFYYMLLTSNDKETSMNEIKQNYQRDLESPKRSFLPPFEKIALEQYTDRPLYGLTEKDPLPEGAEWVTIDG